VLNDSLNAATGPRTDRPAVMVLRQNSPFRGANKGSLSSILGSSWWWWDVVCWYKGCDEQVDTVCCPTVQRKRLNCYFFWCHHSQTALIQSEHNVQSSSVCVWRRFWPHPTFTDRKADKSNTSGCNTKNHNAGRDCTKVSACCPTCNNNTKCNSWEGRGDVVIHKG
jgi:hypothetical protein